MVATIGVPVKLLHESEGHRITVELTDGSMYRGMCIDTEDTMNLQLQNVTYIGKNGQQSKLEYVYIRGSQLKYIILPDMLKNAPMFKRFDPTNKEANSVKITTENNASRGGRGGDRGRGRGRGR